MIKTLIIVGFLLTAPFAEGKVTEPTTQANYIHGLETANAFLWAWSNRDSETGLKLISKNLLSRLKKQNKEDWFRDYMTGLSNPHHSSFEIGKGKTINSKRVTFPVTLYEYYTGEPMAFKYSSKIELVREGDLWRVDVLPLTSDNQ